MARKAGHSKPAAGRTRKRAGKRAGRAGNAAARAGNAAARAGNAAARAGNAAAEQLWRAEPTPETAWAARWSWVELPAQADANGALVALAAAALSGLIWIASSAPHGLWPLSYVGVAPALWAIAKAPTRRRAWLYGWFGGLVANTGGFFWITELLTRFGDLPLPLALIALVLLAGYQSVVFLLFALAVRGIRRVSADRRGAPLPMVIVAPLAMVAFETAVPFIFPWYLAITQASVIPMIQIAEFTGPVGVSAIVMVTGGAVYDALFEPAGRRRIACVTGAAAVIAAVLGFGYARVGQIEARRAAAPTLRVGIVQGNIPMDSAVDPAAMLGALQRASAQLEARGAELILWPESSYPYRVARDAAADAPEASGARIRRGFGVPIALGAITYERGDRDADPYNSAVMMDADGRVTGVFDKVYLLMFGEYTPGSQTFPWIRDLLPQNAGHFTPGSGVTTFPFEHGGKSYRLGPLICYEDILPGFARQLAALHPHLLINLTNDAWFGPTTEPWQHLALSVFRAVEVRTDLVRAVNSGVSAVVDATGRVRAHTGAVDPHVDPPRPPPGTLLGEVVLMEGGRTLYARFGDVFGYLCLLITLLAWLVWPRLGRRA